MKRRSLDPQFDLFAPYIADLSIRDQREIMERPFFSLAKSKRSKPIEYTSPDGDVFVRVTANPEFGMATIWDADILIWATSVLQKMRQQGKNDIPRTLRFLPYELLKSIHRQTGGAEYRLLRESLARLQSTTIVTNLRAGRNKKHRQFGWLESWTDDIDSDTMLSKGMSITISEWFWEGVMMDGGVLSLNPLYFTISGGRERWLYRVARKHAGGAGAQGFAMSFTTLFAKSGADGVYRRFKFELLKIARRDDLPDYGLEIINEGAPDPTLRFYRRDAGSLPEPKHPPALRAKPPPIVSDDMREKIRRDFPGLDLYVLQSEFDEWLQKRASAPDNYNAAFYGFVRKIHARHKHAL